MAILQEFIGSQPLVVWVVLGLIGFGVVWKSADLVDKSSGNISEHLGVPPAISGGIIAAIATSAPELVVIVLSVLVLGEFGLGLGAIVGSAIFNILMIPGIAAIVSKKTKTQRSIVYRDAVFYMVGILGFFVVLALGALGGSGVPQSSDLTPIMGWGLIGLYVIYVFLLTLSKTSGSEEGDVRMHESYNLPKQIGLMAVGLLGVLVGVEAMVTMTTEIGDAIGASNFLVSVTLLSALSSFPDLLVGVKMAQDGRGEAAISNVFGSNSFNILVALSIGVILAGGASVGFVEGVPLLIFLLATTVVVLILASTNWAFNATEGYVMVGLYLIFVLWMVLEALGVTTILTSGTVESLI